MHPQPTTIFVNGITPTEATRHGHAIAGSFGKTIIVPNWKEGDPVTPGALHLCCDSRLRHAYSFFPSAGIEADVHQFHTVARTLGLPSASTDDGAAEALAAWLLGAAIGLTALFYYCLSYPDSPIARFVMVLLLMCADEIGVRG